MITGLSTAQQVQLKYEGGWYNFHVNNLIFPNKVLLVCVLLCVCKKGSWLFKAFFGTYSFFLIIQVRAQVRVVPFKKALKQIYLLEAAMMT